MDKKLKMETLALLLLCAAFPITSWGTMGGQPAGVVDRPHQSCCRRFAAGHDALHGSLYRHHPRRRHGVR